MHGLLIVAGEDELDLAMEAPEGGDSAAGTRWMQLGFVPWRPLDFAFVNLQSYLLT